MNIFFKIFINPVWVFVKSFFYGLSIMWPDNYLGFKLRSLFWKFNNLKLGQKCNISSGSKFYNCRKIKIGSHLTMGNNVLLDANDSNGIFIGKYVSIADGVYFRSANHRFDLKNIPIQLQGHSCDEIIYSGNKYSVVIEDDAWIGARAILLSGAHVGKGSIIAAKAVVNKKVPEYEIWGGVPARFLKKRINFDKNE